MTTKQTTRQNGTPAAPAYTAYHVAEAKDGGKRWIRIGAFFAHEDGQGGNLILDALPFGFEGRVILRAPKAE